jgi:hypothetical protein
MSFQLGLGVGEVTADCRENFEAVEKFRMYTSRNAKSHYFHCREGTLIFPIFTLCVLVY